MLGLRQHVSREPGWISFLSDEENLGGTCNEIDPDLTGKKFLRSRHVDVPGSYNPVRSRDSFGSPGKGRDCLRAPEQEDSRCTHKKRRPQNFRYRPRRSHTDVGNARYM